MPSEAIGKTLRSIMNPSVFFTYVQNSESQFTQQELSKIYDKIEGAMKKTACVRCMASLCRNIFPYRLHRSIHLKSIVKYNTLYQQSTYKSPRGLMHIRGVVVELNRCFSFGPKMMSSDRKSVV